MNRRLAVFCFFFDYFYSVRFFVVLIVMLVVIMIMTVSAAIGTCAIGSLAGKMAVPWAAGRRRLDALIK